MEKIRKFLSVHRVICLLAYCFIILGLIDLFNTGKWLDFSMLLAILILFLLAELLLW